MINNINSFIYFFNLIKRAGAVVINNALANNEDLRALLIDLIYLKNDIKAFTIKQNILYVATF